MIWRRVYMNKRIMAALCALSMIFATPGLASANPPKPGSSEQNSQNLEKKQIENLTGDLIKSYDVENIGEDLKISSEIIDKLSRMKNFHDQEDVIARAIAVSAKKKCFNEIDQSHDVKIKDILKRCLNKACARKYVACSIGRLVGGKFFNNVYNENGEELKDILTECSQNHDAKLNVASAVKDWINSKVCDNYALNNIPKIINLLSKCCDNNDALKKVSDAIYCLVDKNNDIDQKNLYDIFKLLSLCINNDDYSALNGCKAISILLEKNNFLDLIKKDPPIKKDVVDLMRKCWSASIESANTHCIIDKIFSENTQNLFSAQDVEIVKSAKLKKLDLGLKKQRAYSDMEADDILIDEKNICKNIVDKNSEDEKDKSRNKIRRSMNSIFLEHISFMGPVMTSICVEYQTSYGWKRELAISKIKNKFDRFLYEKILNWIKKSPQNQIKSNPVKNNLKEKFDFLETKISLIDKLITQEKDLIKQLILKIMCKNIKNVFDSSNPNFDNEINILKCGDPYDYKIQMEELYFDWIKKYHASCNIKYDIDGYWNSQKAHLAALEDAQDNKTELNFIGKDKNFIETYMTTYAIATAELDAKLHFSKSHKFSSNLNIQAIYEMQFEKVVKNIGTCDGKKCGSRAIYDKDPKSQEIYDKAYLNSIENMAKYDLDSQSDNYYDRLNTLDWSEAKKTYEQAFSKQLFANLKEDVKEDIEEAEIYIPKKINNPTNNVKTYMDIYENNMFKLGFDEFCGSDFPKFEINQAKWKNLFRYDIYDAQELSDFKARLKKSYIEGCKSGCRMRGYFRGFYNDNRYIFTNSKNVILKRLYYEGFSQGIANRENRVQFVL